MTKLLRALFPTDEQIWSTEPLDTNENLRICVNQMATYVYNWYTEILDNTQKQLQVYPIETTTICDVLQMGGLLDETTTIYKPNYEIVETFCQTNSTQLFGKKANQFNRGRLDIQQIITSADANIQSQMIELHKRMGYTNHPMM